MTDVTDAAPGNDNGGMSTPNGRQVPDWVILAIACVAQFMVVLDVSIVNVALPSIGRDLHYSPTGLQWVVNAYVLTFAGFLLLGGPGSRPLRSAPCLPLRARIVHLRQPHRRLRPELGVAHRRTRRARHRRSLLVAGHAHDSCHDVHGCAPREGPRRLECRGRSRRRGRGDPGRRVDGGALVALGPVRQHPHRHRRHGGRPRVPDRGQAGDA